MTELAAVRPAQVRSARKVLLAVGWVLLVILLWGYCFETLSNLWGRLDRTVPWWVREPGYFVSLAAGAAGLIYLARRFGRAPASVWLGVLIVAVTSVIMGVLYLVYLVPDAVELAYWLDTTPEALLGWDPTGTPWFFVVGYALFAHGLATTTACLAARLTSASS